MPNSEKHPLQAILEITKFDCFKYSGRGMMGKECLAVKCTGSPGEFFANFLGFIVPNEDCEFSVAAYVVGFNFDVVARLQEAFRSMRQDSLGYHSVVYFPTVQFVEQKVKQCEEQKLSTE